MIAPHHSRRRPIERIVLTFVALVIFVTSAALLALPAVVDRSANRVLAHAPWPVTPAALELHASIDVADLHADSLLWQRDFLEHNDRGHTDLPRLVEGGVALQVLSAVTKTPVGLNYEHNDADSDMITALAVVQRWPLAAWTSLFERALYQAHRLGELEARSQGALVHVRRRADLERVLASRRAGRPVVGAVLGIEGAHALEGDLARLDALFDAGVRVVGLTHFFDNRLGGSLHGVSREGLSDFGRAVVTRAGELGMVVDVAHASPRAVRDVLALSQRPVILSHAGFKGACDTARNLDDELMRAIAAHGGLIGVGFWNGAVCDPTPRGVARAIALGIELVGADRLALGSDYDGGTSVTFDSSEQAALTQALLDADVDPDDVRRVMGANAIRFFAEQLPE